jgi:serine protease AprX
VVAAAGNSGWKADGLNDPAYDPRLLAVGATDTMGSLDPSDHTVATLSNSGAAGRRADLYAPGVHVVSLRDPGSFIDNKFGITGRVGTRFFRGSGTSQATAIVAGAAALVLQQRPQATPDQVKQLLMSSSTPFTAGGQAVAQGRGQLDLGNALSRSMPQVAGGPGPSDGSGSLEASRGGVHVTKNGVPLRGEQDIFGHAVNTGALARLEAAGSSWDGGTWNGSRWTGSSWDGSSWDTTIWVAGAWTGSSWDGSSWDGSSWDGSSWDGSSWDGSSWDGSSWDGSSWSVASWS